MLFVRAYSMSLNRPMRSLRYSLPFLLLFLLIVAPDLLAQRGRSKPATTGRPVATVNGEPIPLDQYRDAVDDQIRFQRKAGTAAEVNAIVADTIMLGLVDDELVRQEAARRRMAVSREEATKILLKEPPEFMRAPFMDNRGAFRRDVFEMVVRDPSQIVRLLDAGIERDSLVRQWKSDLEKVILYVQSRENRRRVMDALVKEKPLNAAGIRNRYFAENTRVVGSFVRVLHSTIPDSLVPVSVAETRAWYDAHKEDYWAAPARLIGAVVLPVDPTPTDSAVHRVRVDSIRSTIVAAPLEKRARVVDDLLRSLPPNRFGAEPIRPSQLTGDMMKQLATARAGDVVGPFAQESESALLFVERRVPVRDTVLRARHILIRVPPGDLTADSAALELTSVLRDSIDNEAEFIEGVTYFSTENSGDRQGDLGYFGRGRMLHEFDSAAFAGPVGRVIGPVRTQHGYHLIWVNEKITDGFQLRELRVPLDVSKDARDAVARDAEALAAALRGGVGADSIVRAFRGRYPMMATDTTYIKRLDRYGDVLAPARFAFDAKVGDVAVLPLPLNRIMVVRLNAIWSGGTPEFEKIPRHPEAHARRERQLAMLGPRMREIAPRLTPDMLIGPLRELAPDAEVFLLNDRTVTAPPDEEATILDSLVATVPRNSVGGPVRGKHGYYFLRVLEKTGPSEQDFVRVRETFAKTYLERYRTELLTKKIAELRARSTFVDMRVAAE
jgi:peptidyl-prolyl cis-trans isomerase D